MFIDKVWGKSLKKCGGCLEFCKFFTIFIILYKDDNIHKSKALKLIKLNNRNKIVSKLKETAYMKDNV